MVSSSSPTACRTLPGPPPPRSTCSRRSSQGDHVSRGRELAADVVIEGVVEMPPGEGEGTAGGEVGGSVGVELDGSGAPSPQQSPKLPGHPPYARVGP
jgi:hypothetical protein